MHWIKIFNNPPNIPKSSESLSVHFLSRTHEDIQSVIFYLTEKEENEKKKEKKKN